jgi:predicted metal-dependent hydrolase
MKGCPMKTRPSDLVIVSRRIDADPLSFLEKNHVWHQDGVVMTHFINAFQSMFPEGERVFIDAVRDCTMRHPVSASQDPVLKSDLDRFIEQEGRHSVVHDKWTKALVTTGYPTMTAYDMRIHRFRTWARTHMDMMTRLSITIGAEQYTASLARLFSRDRPEIVLHSAPMFQKIFLYHAMEELEHKAVCYDLYRKLHGGYIRRMAGMAFITYYIWVNVLRRHRYLLRKDGAWDRKKKKEFWRFYLGPRGMIWALVPKILEYMRPSFYPWQNDERGEFEERFGMLRTSLGVQGFQYKEMQSAGIEAEETGAAVKREDEVLIQA